MRCASRWPRWPRRAATSSSSTQRVEGYRNFATKLWNAARFAEMNECVRQTRLRPQERRADGQPLDRRRGRAHRRGRHRRHRGLQVQRGRRRHLRVRLGHVLRLVPGADEAMLDGRRRARRRPRRALRTAWVLDQILKLLHPFMPFITEELWARMVEVRRQAREPAGLSSLAAARRPRRRRGRRGDRLARRSRVSEVRSVRSEMNVPAGAKIPLVMVGAGKAVRARANATRRPSSDWRGSTAFRLPRRRPRVRRRSCSAKRRSALPLAGVIDMGGRAHAPGARDREVQGRDQESRRQASQRELRCQGAARSG